MQISLFKSAYASPFKALNNSPLSFSSLIMSNPPMSSPLTYTWGYVGQLEKVFSPCRTSSSVSMSKVSNLMLGTRNNLPFQMKWHDIKINLCSILSRWILNLHCWTRGPGTPPAVKGLVWFSDGSTMMEGTGAGVYGQSADRRVSISRKTCYSLSGWGICDISPRLWKMKLRTSQRNMLVFALIFRQLWKHFRLPKQHLLWYESARRRCMISLPDILWGCTGSLGMPEWKEMISPTSLQGTVLFSGLLDLSLSWGSRGRIYEERWNARWKNSIWYYGVVLVVHRDRLGTWSLALIWLQGPDYCPLIGHNPGLLLACSLDITPWEDIYI